MLSSTLLTALVHTILLRDERPSATTPNEKLTLESLCDWIRKRTPDHGWGARIPIVGKNAQRAVPESSPVTGLSDLRHLPRPHGAGTVFWGRVKLIELVRYISDRIGTEADAEYLDLGTPLRLAGGSVSQPASVTDYFARTARAEDARAIAVVVDSGEHNDGATPASYEGRLKQLVTDGVAMRAHTREVLATLLHSLSLAGTIEHVLPVCSLSRSKPEILGKSLDVLHLDNAVEMLNALETAHKYLATVNRPAVISLSMGTHVGPHTGVSPLETAVDAATSLPTPTFVVVSAGNDGECGVHACCDLDGRAPDVLTLRIGSSGAKEMFVEFWWEDLMGADLSVEAHVTYRSGQSVFSAPALIPSKGDAVNIVPNGTGTQHSLIGSTCGGSLRCITYGLTTSEESALSGGEIRFVLRSRRGAHVHAWLISRLDRFGSRDEMSVLVPSERHGTVTVPSTARSAIAVAGHDQQSVPCTFSSRGVLHCASDQGSCWLRSNCKSPSVSHLALGSSSGEPGTSFAAPRVSADAIGRLLNPRTTLSSSDPMELVFELLGDDLERWNPRVGFGCIRGR